ncbi:Transposase [Dysgonomonas macrotermitis]|uniref:Transposase n=2 Tax=Dysgonomonas macrotermitis TaxID=1346286 RepID=A0A1M4WWW7_9BACT|nr:Transposase [Dysgonomonas macrotermitis]
MSDRYCIGVDVSKKTLDIRIYASENMLSSNYVQVSNDLSGFTSFARWLKQRNISWPDVLICMEHTGYYGYDFRSFLQEKDVFYSVVSGLEIKRSMGLVRGKSDNIDAGRIARYCYLHRDELKRSIGKSSEMLMIQRLLSERSDYKKRASRARAYLTDHRQAPDTPVYRRYESDLKHCTSVLKVIELDIIHLIESDVDLYRNFSLLISIVGISFINAANVLLYTDNFRLFKDARSYASYVGVAPFPYRSGTSVYSADRVSKLCARHLKSDLTQGALSAITHDPELRAYYKRKIASGKSSGSVLNAVKFKLIERMFCVVKRGAPYVKLSNHVSL